MACDLTSCVAWQVIWANYNYRFRSVNSRRYLAVKPRSAWYKSKLLIKAVMGGFKVRP
jgi:hypothetical protein